MPSRERGAKTGSTLGDQLVKEFPEGGVFAEGVHGEEGDAVGVRVKEGKGLGDVTAGGGVVIVRRDGNHYLLLRPRGARAEKKTNDQQGSVPTHRNAYLSMKRPSSLSDASIGRA